MINDLISDKVKYFQAQITTEYREYSRQLMTLYCSEKGPNIRDFREIRESYERRITALTDTAMLVHGLSAKICIYVITEVEKETSLLTEMKRHNMKEFATRKVEGEFTY